MFITNKKFILGITVFLILAEFSYTKFIWFKSILFIDKPLHFLGGVLVASLFLYLFEARPDLFSLSQNKFVSLVMIVSFAALIGLFWEFYEALVEYYFFRYSDFSVFNMTPIDTLSDLFLDLLGGLSAGILYLYSIKRAILK